MGAEHNEARPVDIISELEETKLFHGPPALPSVSQLCVSGIAMQQVVGEVDDRARERERERRKVCVCE